MPDFIKEVKVESNEFITSKKWVQGKFAWQEGYGVFSYGHSQIDDVCRYIINQDAHHAKKTFRQEYLQLLDKFAIDYKEEYVFEFID